MKFVPKQRNERPSSIAAYSSVPLASTNRLRSGHDHLIAKHARHNRLIPFHPFLRRPNLHIPVIRLYILQQAQINQSMCIAGKLRLPRIAKQAPLLAYLHQQLQAVSVELLPLRYRKRPGMRLCAMPTSHAPPSSAAVAPTASAHSGTQHLPSPSMHTPASCASFIASIFSALLFLLSS